MKVPLFEAQTEWNEPEEYPDLRQYDEIAIDLETRDPDLKSKGSGAVIGNGEVVGIAVAVPGRKFYFPIAHGSGPNMDRKRTLEWFQDTLKTEAIKIFHNAMYDVCWIKQMGLKIEGLIVDTMIAASLVDENRFRYDLNSLSWDYLGHGKSEAALVEAAKSRGLDPKADLWQLPAMEVGSYAEKDAELTLELWQIFKKEIIHQDIESVFNLETDLFPCLVDMKFLGVRVDSDKASRLKQELETEEKKILLAISKETTIEPQIWAARSIAKVFDKLSLPYERTAKTNSPSFTKNFLQEHKHPVVKMIAKAREIHGNKYDYSKVEYMNAKTPIKIICPIQDHGAFPQNPSDHLYQESGCPKCGGRLISNTNEFIQKVLNDKISSSREMRDAQELTLVYQNE